MTMSMLTPIPPGTPLIQRLLLKIPVVGWIARDVMFGHRDNIFYFSIIVATIWISCVARWGVAALIVPFALAIPAALVAAFNVLVLSHDRKRRRRDLKVQPKG